MQLQPGDCLLYKPTGFFGAIIAVKTWHAVAHCEVYDGAGTSWASRDGIGVNLYCTRYHELAYVLRPTINIWDYQSANSYARSNIGTPYGWLELLNFVGITHRGAGLFCSEFLTYYYRAAGWNMFPEDDPAQVAPFEFLNLVGAGFTVVAKGDECLNATP